MSRGVADPAVERMARDAYGRLVALLARRSGDLALAEDAVSHALVQALERWPVNGTPDDPEGWLYAVARRALVGHWRHADVRRRKADALRQMATLRPRYGATERGAATGWPDERLPLLFVCAHPAIDPAVRAPLMLRTVLGLTAEEIAPLMGVAPKTMGQRLWRATTKIKNAGIPFDVPEPGELPGRVAAVLDAIYGLYGAGWNVPGAGEGRVGEACWLARVVSELLPDEPEASGLYALLLYAEARRLAGRDETGRYVPLSDQDPGRWDADRIAEADARLETSARAGDVGPFQLEAAIQSAMVHGYRRGQVDHAAVRALYDGLVRVAPTLGARVGRVAAIADADGPAAGLAALSEIGATEGDDFQPFHAVRAELLHRLGPDHSAEARAAYDRAGALAGDPAIVSFLAERAAQL